MHQGGSRRERYAGIANRKSMDKSVSVRQQEWSTDERDKRTVVLLPGT
jgi:hypothetical protein